MALSEEDRIKLAGHLNQTGLPASFRGDRLDVFQFTLQVAVNALAPMVSLDKPKKPPKEKKGK